MRSDRPRSRTTIEPTDPLAATSPDVSRRGFVRIGAGAAAALANGAAATAKTSFGKPHPPIVAEDDPAIIVSRPQLPAPGGPIGAYAAAPRDATSRTPGVVVIQAIWGVDAQLRDVVRRFAKNGFVAVAPALYGRLSPPSGDGATEYTPFAEVAGRMYQQDHVFGDIQAAHDWILTQFPGAKVGITGFCMGGGLVLRALIDSKAFAAASIFYGNVRPGLSPKEPTTASTFDFTSTVTTPLLGSFGARDTSIAPADVTAMFARLTAPHAAKIYDEAGHAFFDDTRDSYVASAAADAWTRTLAWFRRYLT